MKFHFSIYKFSYPKSEDLPASLKYSAFQCCRRLPTGIVPDLKLGKQEEWEGITEVSPWHEEVYSKCQSCTVFQCFSDPLLHKVFAGLSNTSTWTCPEFKHKTKFPSQKVQVLQKMAQFCQLHLPHQCSAHQVLCTVSQILNSSA